MLPHAPSASRPGTPASGVSLVGIWSSTVGAHVPYDSGSTLAPLLPADFDCTVEIIVAQPFQIVGTIEGKVCRRVSDFLLIRMDRTVRVANVKTEMALEKTKARRTFEWVTEILSGCDHVARLLRSAVGSDVFDRQCGVDLRSQSFEILCSARCPGALDRRVRARRRDVLEEYCRISCA